MAPEDGRNVRNKLITITLAVIFMIKILACSLKIEKATYLYRIRLE